MKKRFFDLAKSISVHSDHPQHKLGAVITRGNRIISLGYNKNKTHTKSNHNWKRLHAEISAIIKATEDLNNCSIYIYRQKKDGSLGMARPCVTCMLAIKESGIKKICYSTENGFVEEKL